MRTWLTVLSWFALGTRDPDDVLARQAGRGAADEDAAGVRAAQIREPAAGGGHVDLSERCGVSGTGVLLPCC